MDDLMERKAEELEQLTMAVAEGYAIATSEKARSAWLLRHLTAPEDDDRAAAAARQSATIARLRSYGWHGQNPIKAKAH